jgi:tRNA dimethylallyltransferase
MGPTASGKTDVAVELCRRLDGEVISVDSALVYRGLNIGAAKPSLEERCGVPHHLIDIRDPAEPYSAAEFVRDAKAAIHAIRERGKVPVLVGGTMLYFKALLQGMSQMPASDAAVRKTIEAEASQKGWPAMHEALAIIDPVSAERIHPNHSQRIGRALEVYRISGKVMSEWQVGGEAALLDDCDCLQLCLAPSDRAVLHERIAQRFQGMMEKNFLAEVEELYRREDLHVELPAIRAVGYRQAWDFLDGRCDLNTMHSKILAATRQLAKRQLTWLRAWPELNWIDSLENGHKYKKVDQIVEESLSFWKESTI